MQSKKKMFYDSLTNQAFVCRRQLVAGYWLLATGYWLLVTGCWLLVTGCWMLSL
jgi:hypothetical protein